MAADGGWRNGDDKIKTIKCRWQNTDDKMQMIKCGWKNVDDKMRMDKWCASIKLQKGC